MPPMPPMGPGGRKPGGPHGARLTMEKPKDAKNTLKKLIGYIGRNRYLFFALIGVMLIISPWLWVSRYFIGSLTRLENKSLRMVFTVYCESFAENIPCI